MSLWARYCQGGVGEHGHARSPGWLVLYALVYFFGIVVLRIGPYMPWYLMMLFSIGVVSIVTATAIVAILAVGLPKVRS